MHMHVWTCTIPVCENVPWGLWTPMDPLWPRRTHYGPDGPRTAPDGPQRTPDGPRRPPMAPDGPLPRK